MTQIEVVAPSHSISTAAVERRALYGIARSDRLGFWARQARQLVDWTKPFTSILDWSDAPVAKWFADGELNVAVNCVDRHVRAGHGDRVAIFWEGEPGDSRRITYSDLSAEVNRAANLLASLGVTAGDRVVIYLPLLPEAVVSMLAVARLGAVHSVVFAGFSAESLRARIDDAGAKVVITADGGIRKGKVTRLKSAVDAALAGQTTVEHVLVVQRTSGEHGAALHEATGAPTLETVAWNQGRDLWWHEELQAMDSTHAARGFPAEQPLFILYTSGTTGKPKGILHTSGGYLTQTAFTHRAVFDLEPATDVYWCTADVGWITGHSYVVYGPLANGATQVIYEGSPDTPHHARWWEIVDKYQVSILYTAPTAIRTFMKLGRQLVHPYKLSSLRVLGTVGEPINPEAWRWYFDVVGGGRCPIVDTWWQTETGAIMLSPLAGVSPLKPGSAQTPLPGIEIDIVDGDGIPLPNERDGYLVVTEPWPSMLRGIWGDPERFVETYWSRFAGKYFTGDGAKRDRDGDVWLLGRVDDVMNVSGHRLSTAEIESALVAHPYVAEAAVVGASDETTGQAVCAFVILKDRMVGDAGSDTHVAHELRSWVREKIGPIASPRQILVVPDLPKTRSGKIMRRLLRDVAEERPVGDVTTLSDSSVMDVIGAKISAGHTED